MSKDREVEHAKRQLDKWRREPLRWVSDNFPTVKLSRQQEQFWVALGDIVNAKIKLGNGDKLSDDEAVLARKVGISISAGQGVGKDFITAMAIYWFLLWRT